MAIDELRAKAAKAIADMKAANEAGNDEAYEAAKKDLAKTKGDIARAEELGAEERWASGSANADRNPTEGAGDDKGSEVPQSPTLFRSLGEQLRAAMIAETSRGQRVDRRLLELNDWETRVSGMSEGVPADGGFLVQTDYSTELITHGWAASQLAARCRTFTISNNSNAISLPAVDETSRANGSRWGGVQVYWETEGESTTGKKLKFAVVELKLKKAKAVCYVTGDLLDDAPALESYIGQAFPDELGFVIDDKIVRGEGTSHPLGFLNAPCLVTVAKETGQAADTVVAQNVLQMWSKMPGSLKPGSEWLINTEVEVQLPQMTIDVGTGGIPVYTPANGLSGLPYGTLFGRPVRAIEQASALGDVGDINLVNLTQYYLARKRGVQAASSIHVKFIEDEMAFRFIQRIDGRPSWKSAITPYKAKSGATISPFITLAARA